jgi:hypothetical protein
MKLSKKFNSEDRIETSTMHYENSNGFMPLIVSAQPHEGQNTIKNLTNYNTNIVINRLLLDKNHTKPINPENIKQVFNLSNINENRRSFHINNKENDFELLKVGNQTPSVANYNSFYQNFQKLPNHFNSNANLNTHSMSKGRGRRKRINQSSIHHVVHSASEENKKNSDEYQEESQIYYKPDIITNYNSQKLIIPKTNYDTIDKPISNSESPSMIEKNKEYIIKKPNLPKQNEYIAASTDESTVYKNSPINSYTNTRNIMDPEDSDASESLDKSLLQVEQNNRNYEFINSRGSFEEDLDYTDEIDKSERREKINRKHPRHFGLSRKIPKQHRQVYDSMHDDEGRTHSVTRPRSRIRQKLKPEQVTNDDEKNDNIDGNSGVNSNNYINLQNFNTENTWEQVSPNVEVSHSNNFEINQIEKPKFHIVPLNILSNFDHATALDNSQGFDITNAMITGFVPEGSLLSTPSPLLSSTTNYIISSSKKPEIGISTSAPDIIVGQSSVHNPVQTVLLPNQIQQNAINQYLQSTVAPALFTVTNRPDYSTSNIVPNLQDMLNQVQASFPLNRQLIAAKPLQQSFNNLLKPDESNANIPIYISSNTLQRQNLSPNRNIQPTQRQTDIDGFESKKKKFNRNNSEFVASASLSVDTNTKANDVSINSNTYNNNNHNSENNQQTKESFSPILQSTMVPAFLHTGLGLFNNQNQQLITNPVFLTNPKSSPQIINVPNTLQNTMKQLQYNIQNNQYQLAAIPGTDSNGASSNTILTNNNIISSLQKAQLPILGTNNVEIVNPNLSANSYAINQIPATLLTTPIPIFTTAGILTSKQSFSPTTQKPAVSLENLLNLLHKIETKMPNYYSQINLFHDSQDDRPLYNPINFIPNYELIRNQTILNNNFKNDNKKLNFIPLVSIGNLYKNVQKNEEDVIEKPKISLELEKYAEEMFKESLRTIYNSHKWNNDPRSSRNISLVDNSDFAKLRNELLRLENNLRDSKFQADVLEAHQTENKIRTTNPGYQYKRPDKHYSDVETKPHRHSHQNRYKPKINDFLTPPKINSFVSKNPLRDKPPKKRPSHGAYINTRPRPRQGVILSKFKNTEAKASTITDYRYPLNSNQENNPYSQSNFQGSQSYNYAKLTDLTSENDFKKSSEYSSLEKDFYDINHQRTHNLLGLLMKNRQLPPGRQNKFSTREKNGPFFNENKRMLPQAYENGFRT